MHIYYCTSRQPLLLYIIYSKSYNAATDGGSLVLDLESAEEVAEPEVSDVFEELLFFSSFSELLSMSIGSSLSSFATTAFAPSELSLVFLVTASTDALSTAPFVFVAESRS